LVFGRYKRYFVITVIFITEIDATYILKTIGMVKRFVCSSKAKLIKLCATCAHRKFAGIDIFGVKIIKVKEHCNRRKREKHRSIFQISGFKYFRKLRVFSYFPHGAHWYFSTLIFFLLRVFSCNNYD
jgi:hypothetical protein